MGKIESNLGESTFNSPPPLRKFTVDDPTQHQPVAQHSQEASAQQMSADEIMRLRQQKINEMNRVSDTARRRIEHLVGIGRAHRDIEVTDDAGNKTVFSVRTLKGKEMRHVVETTREAELAKSITGIYNIRLTSLMYSLYAIDGVDIDVVLDCQGYSDEEKYACRSTFLEELDENVLNHIYGKYEDLAKTYREKYAVKTAEQAKEVVEDIKKSGQ